MLTEDDKLKNMGEEDAVKTHLRPGNTHIDASNDVRNLLEFLFLDVKVRSPAEIAELTDQKLVKERSQLNQVPTAQLIKDIRASIEVLLSIKNEQANTNGGRDPMAYQDESLLDRTSLSDHRFHSQ